MHPFLPLAVTIRAPHFVSHLTSLPCLLPRVAGLIAAMYNSIPYPLGVDYLTGIGLGQVPHTHAVRALIRVCASACGACAIMQVYMCVCVCARACA